MDVHIIVKYLEYKYFQCMILFGCFAIPGFPSFLESLTSRIDFLKGNTIHYCKRVTSCAAAARSRVNQ